MKGKNDFLAKQEAIRIKAMEVASDTTEQQMFDYLCLVLNDPAVMGKNVFGAARLEKLHDAIKEVHEQFHEAWEHSPEADYKQEKLDARLREIFGPESPPFRERYPYIEDSRYDRPFKRR